MTVLPPVPFPTWNPTATQSPMTPYPMYNTEPMPIALTLIHESEASLNSSVSNDVVVSNDMNVPSNATSNTLIPVNDNLEAIRMRGLADAVEQIAESLAQIASYHCFDYNQAKRKALRMLLMKQLQEIKANMFSLL